MEHGYPYEDEDHFLNPASYPNDAPLHDSSLQEEDDDAGVERPKILLMGLKRSGKSSIHRVVFGKLSPHETVFLDSTVKPTKHTLAHNSFVNFHVWDFPGQIDFFDPRFDAEHVFSNTGSLVFIIDSQDDTTEAEAKLIETAIKAHEVNPNIVLEVFVHKVDGLSEESKIDLYRSLQQKVSEELTMQGHEDVNVSWHLTSIYDHSVFEAFSKVIQKLITQLPALENLLDMFISHSRIEKAFLFDVLSKIYIATDSSPVDNTTFELCSDMLDVVQDVSNIYGNSSHKVKDVSHTSGERSTPEPAPEDDHSSRSSVIRLNNDNALYLRQVTPCLALVCLMKVDRFEKFGLINYNFQCFKEAIQEVFSLQNSLVAR
jgi:Ras-related GTP-binding protein C/D